MNSICSLFEIKVQILLSAVCMVFLVARAFSRVEVFVFEEIVKVKAVLGREIREGLLDETILLNRHHLATHSADSVVFSLSLFVHFSGIM